MGRLGDRPPTIDRRQGINDELDWQIPGHLGKPSRLSHGAKPRSPACSTTPAMRYGAGPKVLLRPVGASAGKFRRKSSVDRYPWLCVTSWRCALGKPRSFGITPEVASMRVEIASPRFRRPLPRPGCADRPSRSAFRRFSRTCRFPCRRVPLDLLSSRSPIVPRPRCSSSGPRKCCCRSSSCVSPWIPCHFPGDSATLCGPPHRVPLRATRSMRHMRFRGRFPRVRAIESRRFEARLVRSRCRARGLWRPCAGTRRSSGRVASTSARRPTFARCRLPAARVVPGGTGQSRVINLVAMRKA